jgi:hypothetical protein
LLPLLVILFDALAFVAGGGAIDAEVLLETVFAVVLDMGIPDKK